MMVASKVGPFRRELPEPSRLTDADLTELPPNATKLEGRADGKGFVQFEPEKTRAIISCPPDTIGLRIIYSSVPSKPGAVPRLWVIWSLEEKGVEPRVVAIPCRRATNAKLDIFPMEPVRGVTLRLSNAGASIRINKVLALRQPTAVTSQPQPTTQGSSGR
jgi:hypothetical protein